MVPEPVLDVRGVEVRFGERQVLVDVSFSIGPGELVGLIGSNGAGKTTLVKAILGLQPISSGELRVAGRRGGRGNHLVGYVPQKLLLDPEMPLRARDVVALGLDGHRLGLALPSRRRRALVGEALRSVDAEGFADSRVGRLSGGEQQRVLIAHALISRPRLLLLDEPLANLDIASAHQVVGLLSRLAREHGMAVLLSAHDMNPLLPAMDRVVYLARGRAAAGPVDEVVRTDVLTGLYGYHVDVLHVHDRVVVVAGADKEVGRAVGAEDSDQSPDLAHSGG